MKVFYAMFNDGEDFGTAIITANDILEASALLGENLCDAATFPVCNICEIPAEKAQVWEFNIEKKS